MSEQDNIALVKSCYEAFGRGDIETIINAFTTDATWKTPGPPELLPIAGTRHGHTGIKDFFSTLTATEETLAFVPKGFIAQGDNIATFGEYSARVRATGREYTVDWVHLFTFSGNKATSFTELYDTYVVVEAFRAAAAKTA